MICECGAPARGRVCQRGHRLEEMSLHRRGYADLKRLKKMRVGEFIDHTPGTRIKKHGPKAFSVEKAFPYHADLHDRDFVRTGHSSMIARGLSAAAALEKANRHPAHAYTGGFRPALAAA